MMSLPSSIVQIVLAASPADHIFHVDENGNSALHMACQAGKLQVAQCLIQNGANKEAMYVVSVSE